MTSNFFKMTKSLTYELDSLKVLFLETLTAEMMLLIASCQLGLES